MKQPISELVGDCFPEELTLGEYDAARTARIKENVMKKIQQEKSTRRSSVRKTVRIIALVAAVTAVLTATAYAAGAFKMHMDRPEEGTVVSGTWTERDAEGNVENVQTLQYPDAGFVFTFEAEATPHVVKFRPGWLPEPSGGPIFGQPDAEGWYSYLNDDGVIGDDGNGRDIPYGIMVMYMNRGMTLVLNGACELVKEGVFGDYQMKEIHGSYMPEYLNDGNYLLLIDEDEGYCLLIRGTNSMEDMEHIAEELEVMVTDEPADYNPDFNIGIINIGRG